MKLRVVENFTDKYTNEKYKVGQILEVKEARGKELLASPLNVVVRIVEPTKEKKVD